MLVSDQFAAPKGAAVPTLRELPSGEVFAALSKHRQGLIMVFLFSGAINLLYLSPAIYMLQIYDRVLTSRSEMTLIALTGLVIALYVFTGMLEGARASVMAKLGDALESELSPRVYEAMFARQTKSPEGQGNQPLWDLNQVRQFFSGSGLYALLDLPWLPIFILATFLLHPIFGWFSLLGATLLFVTTAISERIARQPLAQASEWTMAANGLAASQLRNTEVIDALGMLVPLAGRWRALQTKARDLQHRAFDQISKLSGITRTLRLVLQSGTLGIGAYLAIQGEITPGVMIAATILSTRALSPLESLIAHWKSMLSTLASQHRLDRLLRDFVAPIKGVSIPRPTGVVTAENIFVAPPSNRSFILKGMTFRLDPGEVVGVVGPSAAGKSTLARTIVGVWPAQLGKLRLDGADIRNWPRSEIGPVIGYLPQDIELFSGTVGENISRFGDLDSEKIIEAANACGIHGMILRLSKGYDTLIGEAGTMLSGGQRQLIGLARAIYGKPSLVVLDEPSSNLDEVGDRCLAQTISTLRSWGSTVVVISHDPKLLKITDKLMMVFDGQIREFGPSAEVLTLLKRASRVQQTEKV
ncbi:MAG: type I secretion system permease/ATPase [Burkholderiaceae bacterium]|nr:type I secretion system permease/ATPase [Burkholderiaceae bacterium]